MADDQVISLDRKSSRIEGKKVRRGYYHGRVH